MQYKILLIITLLYQNLTYSQIDSNLLVFERNFCHNSDNSLKSYSDSNYKINFRKAKLESIETADSSLMIKDGQLYIVICILFQAMLRLLPESIADSSF